MKKIKALRQFSHYHAGNFDQGEIKPVSDSVAEALVGMKLAEVVGGSASPPEKQPEKAAKPVRRSKDANRTD